jgi:hypothetical protein
MSKAPAVPAFVASTEQDLFHIGLHLEVQNIRAALENLLLVRDGLVAREKEPAEREGLYDGLSVPIQAVSASVDKLKEMIEPKLVIGKR